MVTVYSKPKKACSQVSLSELLSHIPLIPYSFNPSILRNRVITFKIREEEIDFTLNIYWLKCIRCCPGWCGSMD